MNLPGEDRTGDGSRRFDELTQRAGFGTSERTERAAKCKGSRAHEMARQEFVLVEGTGDQWSRFCIIPLERESRTRVSKGGNSRQLCGRLRSWPVLWNR